MKPSRNLVITLLFSLLLLFSFTVKVFDTSNVSAETEEEKLERLSEEVEQYEQEIDRLKSQASTLSNQIAQYNARVRLATLRIAQTEEKIFILGGRINQLEYSLQALTSAFSSRVVRSYKMSRLNEPYLMFASSPDLSGLVSSFHYLKRIQEADRDLLVKLEDAQNVYEGEKQDQEVLQIELEEQKAVLGAQKAAKTILLEQTRNDEKRYQDLLAAVRAEFEAIQAIIAGRGEEELVGTVNQGQRIATIIRGPSCNSSGAHLHFMVSQGSTTQNPFSHLKPGIDFENCSGSSCGSGDGDAFNPSGSWDWPIVSKIKFTQGYGSTWAVRNTWVGRVYSFHNGIDINNDSSEVRAVMSGDLYRGSYTGTSGCRLRYVRVDHNDSELDTYYLHINY